MKTIFKIVFAFFLINSVMISSEYAWVRKTLIVDNPEFQMRTKSAVKDELNIIAISKTNNEEYLVSVIINGEENTQLKSNLEVMLEDEIYWNSLYMLYNRQQDLFYIFSKSNIIILEVSTKEISTILFPNSFQTLKHFGLESFYISNSVNEKDTIKSNIYDYQIGNNNVIREAMLSIKSEEYRITDFSFSVENEVLVFSEKNNEAFYIPKVEFYDENRNVKVGFDFSASYFDEVFYNSVLTNSIIKGMYNLDEDTWVLAMHEKGYYVSNDDAETWTFVFNPLQSGGDQEIHNIPNSDKYLLSFGYGKNSHTFIKDNLLDVGTEIKIISSDLSVIEFGDGYAKRNISIGANKEIYSYGQDGWIYKLESVEITSVEDSDNLVNIRIDPNPVNDILQISANSDIQIESLTIYDLLGNKLIEQAVNGSNHNLEVNCSTLMTGTYILIAQTKNGNITNKFIKQ
ncbi:MAG: T9SS type A sorting domain-containing protein [Candidatus Kapaibacterium sp.]